MNGNIKSIQKRMDVESLDVICAGFSPLSIGLDLLF